METSELFAASFRMIAALALVLGVVILAMSFLRKAMSRSMDATGRTEIIRIKSVRYLGGKNSIALVDVAGTVIVVGMSPSGMSTLAHIADPDSLEQLDAATAARGEAGPFARQLARYAARLRAVGPLVEKTGETRT